MADPDKTKAKAEDDDSEVQAAPKKNKRKLFLFIGIGVLVLAFAAGGAFFLLGGKKKHEGEGEEAAPEEHQEAKHDQPPVYLKLDTFTTNLAAEEVETGTGAQYIQVVVELKLADARAAEELKLYMPEIRNGILRLLSGRKPSQLASVDGKDLLAGEIRDSVNSVVNGGKKGKGAKGPVEAVLFSSFIIQ